MELEDWAAAGDMFEDLHTRYPVLAPYPAYQAARCRLRRGDNEGALAWVARVPEGTVLEAEAALIRLDALAALNRFAEVEREGAQFLERFPNGPRRAEAMFQRAQAMEKLDRPAVEVAALYRKIWSEAPLEAWARRAEERLSDLASRQAAARPAAAKLAPPPAPGGSHPPDGRGVADPGDDPVRSQPERGGGGGVRIGAVGGRHHPAGRRQPRAALPGGVPPGAEPVQAARADAGGAPVRPGPGGLQAGGQQGPVHQVDVPGRPQHEHRRAEGRGAEAVRRPGEGRAPSTATPTTPGCGRRRSTGIRNA